MRSVVADRYEVDGLIGSGGAAEVFEARDRRLGRRVAVKFLRGDLRDTRARRRFEREALIAAQLVHPHAVRVYDLGDEGGQPFLVMELVDGTTLAELLARGGPLPADRAISVADDLLSALAAAHELGLVHRDVKPANVLIGRDRITKLADFGIAKAVGDATSDVTATGQVVGTPKYLAPEQAAGRGATPQSDLYAVGVVLYEMLAGQPPFQGGPLELAVAHQQTAVPSLLERRPSLAPGVARVVERALAKNPADRFANAPAMRAALAAAAAGQPDTEPDPTAIAPLPVPAPGPVRRRRPWILVPVAALAALVAILALVPGGGSSTPTHRSTPTPRVVTVPSTAAPTTPSTDTPTTPEPSTEPTTTPPSTAPPDVPALIGLLSSNPSAFGSAGPSLLQRLEAVQANPDQSSTRAARTIRAVRSWVADGQLDPSVGAAAVTLLTPIAATMVPPRDGGGGNGRGQGGGGD